MSITNEPGFVQTWTKCRMFVNSPCKEWQWEPYFQSLILKKEISFFFCFSLFISNFLKQTQKWGHFVSIHINFFHHRCFPENALPSQQNFHNNSRPVLTQFCELPNSNDTYPSQLSYHRCGNVYFPSHTYCVMSIHIY